MIDERATFLDGGKHEMSIIWKYIINNNSAANAVILENVLAAARRAEQ